MYGGVDWLASFLGFVFAVVVASVFSTVAGLSLYAATGSKLCIQRAGSVTCSGLVCEALTRAGIVWARPPYACTPADISAQLQPGKASWLDADTRREARLASRA